MNTKKKLKQFVALHSAFLTAGSDDLPPSDEKLFHLLAKWMVTHRKDFKKLVDQYSSDNQPPTELPTTLAGAQQWLKSPHNRSGMDGVARKHNILVPTRPTLMNSTGSYTSMPLLPSTNMTEVSESTSAEYARPRRLSVTDSQAFEETTSGEPYTPIPAEPEDLQDVTVSTELDATLDETYVPIPAAVEGLEDIVIEAMMKYGYSNRDSKNLTPEGVKAREKLQTLVTTYDEYQGYRSDHPYETQGSKPEKLIGYVDAREFHTAVDAIHDDGNLKAMVEDIVGGFSDKPEDIKNCIGVLVGSRIPVLQVINENFSIPQITSLSPRGRPIAPIARSVIASNRSDATSIRTDNTESTLDIDNEQSVGAQKNTMAQVVAYSTPTLRKVDPSPPTKEGTHSEADGPKTGLGKAK